jgi:hypothetical protein
MSFAANQAAIIANLKNTKSDRMTEAKTNTHPGLTQQQAATCCRLQKSSPPRERSNQPGTTIGEQLTAAGPNKDWRRRGGDGERGEEKDEDRARECHAEEEQCGGGGAARRRVHRVCCTGAHSIRDQQRGLTDGEAILY